MEGGMGHSRGSMNPWAESEEYLAKPNWNNINGFETPFGAMAELLQTWPGPTQTSEQDINERYFRLICTIAGYPEILSGRRPLDIPLHKKSDLAFKLSEFLDKIKPESDYEWHSLRTIILHYDLINNHQDRHNNKKMMKDVVQYLISNIRQNSTYSGHSYYDSDCHIEDSEVEEEDCSDCDGDGELDYHIEEIRFLNALHSNDTDRISQYWPQNIETPIRLHLNMIYINSEEKRRNYIEHEFKFDEIKSWIKKWSMPKNATILHENFAQKWIVAASGILESLFAMMRNYILKERRPGSIVVDGGGRISYISTRGLDYEKEWFEGKLYNSFIFDRFNQHPFSETIRTVIEEYTKRPESKNKRNIVAEKLRQRYEGLENQLWDLERPLRELYKLLIGKKSAKFFFPKVVVDKSKKRTNDSRYLINPSPAEMPWLNEKCVFCNDTNSLDNGLKFSSSRSLVNKEIFICPFHYMFEGLARTIGIRHTSYSELFEKQPAFIDSGKILTDIIRFDGNSIGEIFSSRYQDFRQPNNQLCLELWNKEKDLILNTEKKYSFAGQGTEEELYEQKQELFHSRLQVLIRKQRRSFDFNSKWWVALRSSMKENKECSLVPWILAGDDIVLVNKSASTSESILRLLDAFHHNLADVFKGRITFAGSIQQRKTSDTILESYNLGEKLEENASLVWKRLAERDYDYLLNDKKIEKLNKDWNSGEYPDAPQILEWIQSDGATKFVFKSTYDTVSIMIPSNWNEEEE